MGHVINKLDVRGKELFNMITCEMTIDAMPIADSKEIIILDRAKVLNDKV